MKTNLIERLEVEEMIEYPTTYTELKNNWILKIMNETNGLSVKELKKVLGYKADVAANIIVSNFPGITSESLCSENIVEEIISKNKLTIEQYNKA